MKSLRRRVPELISTLKVILERYDRYSRYLDFPGEWGERVFRGWVAFEIVHAHLRWPVANIVFGEKYDILMVDDNVKPVVYLETKRPRRGLADVQEFLDRLERYPTLVEAVLANGYEWLRLDLAKKTEERVNLKSEPDEWMSFIKPLVASNFLYGAKP